MLHVRRHLFHEFLFVYLSFLPDTDVIMALVQYSVCCVTHSFQIRRKTFVTALNNASVDQWHSRLKTRICAEGGHFKHMTEINLCR